MSGKHRSDIEAPTLLERIEFLAETWENELNNAFTQMDPDHPHHDADSAWLRGKHSALIQLKRVLKEGDW